MSGEDECRSTAVVLSPTGETKEADGLTDAGVIAFRMLRKDNKPNAATHSNKI